MAEQKTAEKTTFTKEQIVHSVKYRKYRDFLSGNLKKEQLYTTDEVDKLIDKYYGKGKSAK